MKITILREKLKEGLSIIERISIKSLTLPILNNVLIQTKKSLLGLSATDLEVGIKWWALSKIDREGEIIIPTRLLANIVSLLPEKQVSLEAKGNNIIIECENSRAQIKGFSSEDFPIIPEISRENHIEINAASFCQGLSQVADFATPSQARPEISGPYLSFQEDAVKMVATDSFRLGEKTLSFAKISTAAELSKEGISFILPQKTAKEIINIFGEKEGKLRIYFSPGQVLFESWMAETSHPQIQLTSRLIEGEYPAYQEIIPKKYETQVILNRNEFLNQIKIASLLSGKTNEVRVKIDTKKGRTEISSQDSDAGEHRSFLEGKARGEPSEVSFNYRFLSDGLQAIKSSEVLFELNGEEGPAAIRPAGDQSYIYVVMPIKTS